mgnify:FL=1
MTFQDGTPFLRHTYASSLMENQPHPMSRPFWKLDDLSQDSVIFFLSIVLPHFHSVNDG